MDLKQGSAFPGPPKPQSISDVTSKENSLENMKLKLLQQMKTFY